MYWKKPSPPQNNKYITCAAMNEAHVFCLQMEKPRYKKRGAIVRLDANCQMERVTAPQRRHRAQTWTRVGVPFTSAFTFLIFGFQARLVFLLE